MNAGLEADDSDFRRRREVASGLMAVGAQVELAGVTSLSFPFGSRRPHRHHRESVVPGSRSCWLRPALQGSALGKAVNALLVPKIGPVPYTKSWQGLRC